MSSTGWDQMAEYWDAKLGDEGDLWHRTLIDPPLLQLVGPTAGLRVLDLACGNGYLCRRFARQGAVVSGLDACAPVIERARLREARAPLGIEYHVADAAQLQVFETGTFDLVVCNMALMDIEDAAGALLEVGRVLRHAGRLVASLSHPCFDKVNDSGWSIDYIFPHTTVWRKISHYREIAMAEMPWAEFSDQTILTRAYHRPLSWYFHALRAAGLAVTAFEEPEPTGEFLRNSQQGPWIAEIPLHCVIEARKPA